MIPHWHDVKVGGSSETPVFSEADLNTKKEFSEERLVSGKCTGAKGKIDLQASGIEQEKKEYSKRQESSKTGKMKIPFLPFKKKGKHIVFMCRNFSLLFYCTFGRLESQFVLDNLD